MVSLLIRLYTEAWLGDCYTTSRPSISYSMWVCVRYHWNSKEIHLANVKRIIHHVSRTKDYGTLGELWWSQEQFERLFFLGKNLVSWLSKKHNNIVLSTTEAEYISARSNCAQIIWMKDMFFEYDVINPYCNDISAVSIFKNPIQNSRTEHIDIRHHLSFNW